MDEHELQVVEIDADTILEDDLEVVAVYTVLEPESDNTGEWTSSSSTVCKSETVQDTKSSGMSPLQHMSIEDLSLDDSAIAPRKRRQDRPSLTSTRSDAHIDKTRRISASPPP